MSLIRAFKPQRLRRLFLGLGIFLVLLMIALGVFASNGWLPHTDALSGKKTGWFGKELPKNASSVWNPWAAPLPGGTPQLSKEYIYAGSRLLAVEDANAGATPTPPPYGFEGDVSPHNLGDGLVLSGDVSVIRNFASGLETPDPSTNEFQRADEAPRSTLGDCEINAADVTQVRRYSSGLDPLTAAGGPVSPTNCGGSLYESGVGNAKSLSESNVSAPDSREIRIQNMNGVRGQTVTIPVFMKLVRDEVAVLFTLEYDTTRLTNPQLSLSDDLPSSAVLTANVIQPGRIGILVDALTPFSTTPQSIRIVFIKFDVRPTAPTGSSQLRMTSSLARQSVADTGANLLVTSYTNGSISITN